MGRRIRQGRKKNLFLSMMRWKLLQPCGRLVSGALSLPISRIDYQICGQISINNRFEKLLESAFFYQKLSQATSRNPSDLLRSILSTTNFLKIEFWDESERNSGRVSRSAMAVTCSEGEKAVRTVLNQEPNEE